MSAVRISCAACAALAVMSFAPSAVASGDLSGQWVGNSQLDGKNSDAKTTLVLGPPDAADSMLRLEERSTCVLRGGRYTAAADGGWSLSFKEGTGSDACARLARGAFTLQQGSSPRSLQFDVTYPGPDGKANLRRGLLSRYP